MFRNLASSHLLLGSFSNDNGDGNQTSKKQYVYDAKPSLHNYDVKMPNCKFYGGRKQVTIQEIGINATKIEKKTGIHLKTDVFAAVAAVDAKAP